MNEAVAHDRYVQQVLGSKGVYWALEDRGAVPSLWCRRSALLGKRSPSPRERLFSPPCRVLAPYGLDGGSSRSPTAKGGRAAAIPSLRLPVRDAPFSARGSASGSTPALLNRQRNMRAEVLTTCALGLSPRGSALSPRGRVLAEWMSAGDDGSARSHPGAAIASALAASAATREDGSPTARAAGRCTFVDEKPLRVGGVAVAKEPPAVRASCRRPNASALVSRGLWRELPDYRSGACLADGECDPACGKQVPRDDTEQPALGARVHRPSPVERQRSTSRDRVRYLRHMAGAKQATMRCASSVDVLAQAERQLEEWQQFRRQHSAEIALLLPAAPSPTADSAGLGNATTKAHQVDSAPLDIPECTSHCPASVSPHRRRDFRCPVRGRMVSAELDIRARQANSSIHPVVPVASRAARARRSMTSGSI
eukprot:TRINITY_DN20454_c0_g1_i1.p1 TRINITY_DN20454_c0_g1~~TRINITY_DN20454_c0_g1_i1.p1  ORF type:complete len:425 (+),score=62.33 TRINITY_DN20454_c0_g1_i1:83-1357(+)